MSNDNPPAPYENNLEHLSDCLLWVDRLVSLCLLRQGTRRPANPLESFKGLVITEEETAQLLKSERDEEGSTSAIETAVRAVQSLANEICQRRAASIAEGVPLTLVDLAQIFNLNPFEESCLIVALAPELSRKYEKLFAFLHDDVTRKKPTVDLALTLLCPTFAQKVEHRAAFEPSSPLTRYRLIEVIDDALDARSPLISRALKLDDRIADHLLGSSRLDARLGALAKLVEIDVEWGDPAVDEVIQTRLRDFIASHAGVPDAPHAIFHFHGPEGCASQYLARCVCRGLGLPLLLGDGAKMLGKTVPPQELLWLLGREASLQPALLGVENIEALIAAGGDPAFEAMVETAATFSRVSFLFGRKAWAWRTPPGNGLFIDVPLPSPDAGQRKRLWESARWSGAQFADDVDPGALASKFLLTPGQIDKCLTTAATLAHWRSPADTRITMEDVQGACRAECGSALATLASKIEPIYRWEDIVLPADALAQLREMCDRVNQRHRVLSEWGFSRKLSLGRGINALFAGPSGTGKTMAAQIMANELSLDLFRIDLSIIVSKYIGETEKNLSALFAAAGNSNVILFFDEADSLFGKRSEVRDSHDRYANLEISYLLQKMEDYEGVAILATNLPQNLDESFLRRLAFTVHFPFPDDAGRLRIWTGIWPSETPLALELDFDSLARRFKLSGGNIRNIALAAANLAASSDGIVRMEHLYQATRREFQKMGKVLSEEELRGGGNGQLSGRT